MGTAALKSAQPVCTMMSKFFSRSADHNQIPIPSQVARSAPGECRLILNLNSVTSRQHRPSPQNSAEHLERLRIHVLTESYYYPASYPQVNFSWYGATTALVSPLVTSLVRAKLFAMNRTSSVMPAASVSNLSTLPSRQFDMVRSSTTGRTVRRPPGPSETASLYSHIFPASPERTSLTVVLEAGLRPRLQALAPIQIGILGVRPADHAPINDLEGSLEIQHSRVPYGSDSARTYMRYHGA
ncbi:uncharacterized protein LAESUDRAFT_362331 [Laetiporus sulphureus 93-53]|uniref:Uncharacterized protein n=1 Tax=Laetiporus sulphureus 93-53 TaxID=1314785 RepID=A0A165GZ61_9APHY|nr:uncharacterized protein LAESUDRAFT_362331 [Laetiporus sulphureus 93-53]KZT11030.1 hypothetical protein LAESUDRAFT_362331 [Laetiporus sulphureus 93-53]